jgi:hypothetical protein
MRYRPLTTCLIILLLALLVHPSTADKTTGSQEIAAAGDHSVYLPGVRPGESIDLSGYVQVPYSPHLNPDGGEMTIEAWVKRDAADRHETIVGNGMLTSYWFGWASGGQLRFFSQGLGSLPVDSASAVPAGVWTHVAVTYDGTTLRYFINGKLDSSSKPGLGDLTPAPAGQPLGIGFDPDDIIVGPNYFAGFLDNMRIWGRVRSAPQIEAGMFQSYGAGTFGLLAEWSFDGDASEPVNGLDGIPVGTVVYDNEGALPHDIRIPQVSQTPTLDGSCGVTEYAGATRVTVDGTGVLLLHSADDLWACFEDVGEEGKLAAVYLDAEHTRLDPAQPNHLRLVVSEDGSTQATAGNGSGSYIPTTVADGRWEGVWLECCGNFPTYRAELRINDELLGGWGHVIGLALSKVPRVVVPGHTHIPVWPALADATLPSTWSGATLGGTGPQRTFSGHVVYQPRDSSASPVGIPGVAVDLIGRDPSGSEALVARAMSSLSGHFSLTGNDDYAEHRLELGAPPRGYVPRQAVAGAGGIAVDARTVDYGDVSKQIYPDNTFILGDALPYIADVESSPYLQIIASKQIIDSGALEEFRDFKTRQGFAVGIDSVETIAATYPSGPLRDRIRAFEQDRLAELGSRFQYVLLVGWDDVIPFVRFTPWFNGRDKEDQPDFSACLDPEEEEIKIKYSEWMYVDLVSDFDSNGNGCPLDGMVGDPVDHDFAPGYVPDTMPNYQVNVAVGRIPFNTPAKVEHALRNSMRFEQQSAAFKGRTLHAMSQPGLKGQYWIPQHDPTGHYKPCPGPKGLITTMCSDDTNDAAYVSEYAKTQFLDILGFSSTRLYEEIKPEGAVMVATDPPLTYGHVLQALEEDDYGFVNLAGHGGSGGVGRTFWDDVNGNGVVDAPTEPRFVGDPPSHLASIMEIKGAPLIETSGLETLTPANGRGAIYDMGSCSISSARDPNNFGASLLDGGHGVASIGALNTTGGGDHWHDPSDKGTGSMQYYVSEKLLRDNLRVGATLWGTLEWLAIDGDASAGLSTELYGDPTLSYWGNPGGQSTLAAWPMLRYDARGQGYTTLAGPERPIKLWEYEAYVQPSTPLLLPSPVVSNNGEVIVAHGTYVDVLRGGELFQRLSLGWPAFGTPAIAADGTIYVLDTTGNLYAFVYRFAFGYPVYLGGEFGLPERELRWTVDLGDIPLTSPTIGPDGFIAVGQKGELVLTRPDGVMFHWYSLGEYPKAHHPVGMPAVGGDRVVYVASQVRPGPSPAGHLARLDFFCFQFEETLPPLPCRTDLFSDFEYTAPLLAYGFVYTGRSDQQVLKHAADTLAEEAAFAVDGQITAGPIAGPGGQVLVGTDQGTLYSLTKGLALRWQRSIGAPVESVPAFSADALYIVSDDWLLAYHPFSGAPLWRKYLGAGAGDGSVAVGYGREIYVQTTSGKILAYGEGWPPPPLLTVAHHLMVDGVTPAIEVRWLLEAEAESRQAGRADSDAITFDSTPAGILLQRSTSGGDWEDLAILAPDTEAYYDTDVLPDTGYAYRAQVFDSEGYASDFTTTMIEAVSLPRIPGAPQLLTVTVEGAETLGLEWSSAQADIVDQYRVERSLSALGPFTPTQKVSGEVTGTVDTDLNPGTTYHYRVVAVNDTGESVPSNVLSGTTRERSLSAPENATAELIAGGRVKIDWDAGPNGARTIIEYSERGLAGYEPLGTAGAAGPWSYRPGEPTVYVYRLKFVLGEAESPYAQTDVVIVPETSRVFLPLILR